MTRFGNSAPFGQFWETLGRFFLTCDLLSGILGQHFYLVVAILGQAYLLVTGNYATKLWAFLHCKLPVTLAAILRFNDSSLDASLQFESLPKKTNFQIFRPVHNVLGNLKLRMVGSGGGSVGRAVASKTIDPGFESF